MKIEPCAGCGRMILVERMAGLTIRCEPTPLTDVGDIVRMLTSPNPPSLWMVERNEQGSPVHLRGARRGELGPVPEHRCPASAQTALSRPRTPSKAPEVQPTPPVPSAGQQTPSSGPQTAPSSARCAVSPRSDEAPRCDDCGLIMAEGDYAAIQVGEIYVWAQHLVNCER